MKRTDAHRSLLVGALLVAVLAAGCGDGGGTSPDRTIVHSGETENVGIILDEPEGFITLRGRFFGPLNEVGVILSHMLPNDQRAWSDFAQELADEGYAVLTFDFRGFGESEGDRDFAKLDEDLSAAVRFLRDRGKSQIFLIGASMGGTTSLVVAAREDLAGVVVVSAPARFDDQDALSVVFSVSEPKLFIGSEDDTSASGFEELLEAAAGPKESEIYSGSSHGTDLLQSEHAAAFGERVLQFLGEHSGS